MYSYILAHPIPSLRQRYKLIYNLLKGIKCLYCETCEYGIIKHCDLKLENLLQN